MSFNRRIFRGRSRDGNKHFSELTVRIEHACTIDDVLLLLRLLLAFLEAVAFVLDVADCGMMKHTAGNGAGDGGTSAKTSFY